jgi:hypothetical protein
MPKSRRQTRRLADLPFEPEPNPAAGYGGAGDSINLEPKYCHEYWK